MCFLGLWGREIKTAKPEYLTHYLSPITMKEQELYIISLDHLQNQ